MGWDRLDSSLLRDAPCSVSLIDEMQFLYRLDCWLMSDIGDALMYQNVTTPLINMPAIRPIAFIPFPIIPYVYPCIHSLTYEAATSFCYEDTFDMFVPLPS